MLGSMKKKNIHSFDFYCLLFFVLSFAGWVWEVVLHFFTSHAFINRGVYKGPYLPIYGVGGLLLSFFLKRFRKKPPLVFALSLMICSVLEYFTSWFLERKWGVRWWDYSGHFMNLKGRICLMGALVFGAGGTALVCWFVPVYEKWVEKLPVKLRLTVCVISLVVFAADAAHAEIRPNVGEGITSEEEN